MIKTWSAWSATNFWWFWGASAVIGAMIFCIFASLCARGIVSPENNLLPWCAILFVLVGVIGGSLWLRSTGHGSAAMLSLLLLIAPIVVTLAGTLLFSAFYFLVFIFGEGRMN